MKDLIFWILWPVSVILAFIGGVGMGSSDQLNNDADQSVSDDPSLEWRRALIDAEARKQKKGLK